MSSPLYSMLASQNRSSSNTSPLLIYQRNGDRCDRPAISVDSSSSWSFELFVVSIIQEDVYIGHTALALTLDLRVFSLTGATTMGKLLGPTTCLPHKGEGIPLNPLPKDTTSKLVGLFSTLSLFCWAPSREAMSTIFLNILVWLDQGNEPQVYRLRSGRSNHHAIQLNCMQWKSIHMANNLFKNVMGHVYILHFTAVADVVRLNLIFYFSFSSIIILITSFITGINNFLPMKWGFFSSQFDRMRHAKNRPKIYLLL